WIGYDDGPFTADLFMRWMSSHKSINNKGGTAFNIAHFNSDFNADARIGYKLSDRMELSFSGFNLIGADSTTTGLKIDRRFIATAKINLN
ncbi:MAG: hypothetical protein KDG54_13365, partial [Geminicoccaceae bacterium]|nr:hypothetical protein [Geminicoccaceae bacterium]